MEPGSLDEWQALIRRFLRDHLERSGAKGVVIGISGGIDSSLTAALCVDAFGVDRVRAVLMPHRDSDPDDLAAGQALCAHLGLESHVRDITPIVDGVNATLPGLDAAALGNAKARARMMTLYAEAQTHGLLVCGTGNKSELLVGYFTKHGDGGVDLEPIGDLYKTQVWSLARHMGLPADLVDRTPSAGLVAGQTDEQDLGMSYEALDAVLKCIELNTPEHQIPDRTGASVDVVGRVLRMVRRSEHKRHAALIPKIGARTVGIDWRRSVHWD